MIKEGDVVVALHDGAQGPNGPAVVPKKGKIYRVTSVYPMCYGAGVTLEGLNPAPYRGFFLFVHVPCSLFCFDDIRPDGWYFAKVDKADEVFTEQMRNLKPNRRKLSDIFKMPIRVKEDV